MNRKILTLIAASAFLSVSGPAWAFHGDCVTNSSSGTEFSVPEPAGDLDHVQTGIASAIATGNTPLSVDVNPCGDQTFPTIFEIPNANANGNGKSSAAPIPNAP